MSSILREDQYFDNECEFCIATGVDALNQLEQIFLKNRISYFIRDKHTSVFRRILKANSREAQFIVRINNRDIALATELAQDLPGIRITGRIPESDWSPKEKLKRLNEQKQEYYDEEE